MLATAAKHEWEKDSPVLSFEVNGAVLQNDWSMGKHHLVNVFSVQCDRGTAARLFSPPPQGANFTPGKIDMERWAASLTWSLSSSPMLCSLLTPFPRM